MECEVCGAIIDDGSKYCQKCGIKLKGIGISKEELSNVLIKKMELIHEAGTEQTYQKLISKLKRNEYKKVEIHTSSLDEADFSKMLIESKNGILIVPMKPEEHIKLGIGIFINELDSMQNEMNSMKNSLQNDRISKIYTAFQQYNRAIHTNNTSDRTMELNIASNNCLSGINDLRQEINEHIKFFSKLPKSTIQKLFCGISLKDAENELKQVQKSFQFYRMGISLLTQIDIYRNEQEMLISTAQEERAFLKEIKKSKGFHRLLEVDDENVGKWEEDTSTLSLEMYYIENYLETGKTVMEIK